MNGRNISLNVISKTNKSKTNLIAKIDLNSPIANKSYVGISQDKKKLRKENSLEKSYEKKGNLIC